MRSTAVAFRYTILITAVTLTIWTLPAQGAARGEFARTLQVNGAVNLQVETGSGSIDVRTGSSSEVRVVGHIWANEWFSGNAEERVKRLESNPPIQQSGNDIRIGHIDDPERSEERRVGKEGRIRE